MGEFPRQSSPIDSGRNSMSVASEHVYTGMIAAQKNVGGFLGPIFGNMATKKAFCRRFHELETPII